MTPSALLLLWLANWLLTSSVVVFFLKNRPGESASADLRLWDLEDNLPALVALLLAAWPMALYRLLPTVLPRPPQRGSRR